MQSISLWVTGLQQFWRGLIPEPALVAPFELVYELYRPGVRGR